MQSAHSTTRRTFLKDGSTTIAAASALTGPAIHVVGANERLNIGVIGCGGRARSLARAFAERKDAAVTFLCDPDSTRLTQFKEQHRAAQTEADVRRLLDSPNVDAVIIATPDHWHAPAAILAADARKHVYVEKPCSHNVREGRLMVEAARRNNVVMQVGTQSRSSAALREVIAMLREGAIGKVLAAKAVNSQLRKDIGRAGPSDPPAELDYELWVGPAPMVPFRPTCHHYTWHWWYAFGTGDMGNDGVHELDVARWGLGVDDIHPTTITAHGAKLFFEDDQQFPDTQMAVFEYPGDGGVGNKRVLIYEHRIWTPYSTDGVGNGNIFYGDEGKLVWWKNKGWTIYGPKDVVKVKGESPISNESHVEDFVAAVRGGRRPSADIEIGHKSATLTHLGNIAARVGRTLRFDPASEQIVGDEKAARLIGRRYRNDHWAVPKGATG